MTARNTTGKAGTATAPKAADKPVPSGGLHNRIAGEMGVGAKQENAESKKEAKRQKFIDAGAVVLTKNDEPDMRLVENRLIFMKDPSKTVNDKPDERFLTNRPDLQEVRRKRGTSRPNLIFTNDGGDEE